MQLFFAENGATFFCGYREVDAPVYESDVDEVYQPGGSMKSEVEPGGAMKQLRGYVRVIRGKDELLDAVRTELNQAVERGKNQPALSPLSMLGMPSQISNADVLNGCRDTLTVSVMDDGFGVMHVREVDLNVKARIFFAEHGRDGERAGVEFEGDVADSIPSPLRTNKVKKAYAFTSLDEVLGFVAEAYPG